MEQIIKDERFWVCEKILFDMASHYAKLRGIELTPESGNIFFSKYVGEEASRQKHSFFIQMPGEGKLISVVNAYLENGDNFIAFSFSNDVFSEFPELGSISEFLNDYNNSLYVRTRVDFSKKESEELQYNLIESYEILDSEGNSMLPHDLKIIRQDSKKPLYLVVDSVGEPVKDRSLLREFRNFIEEKIIRANKRNLAEDGLDNIEFVMYSTVLIQEALLEKNPNDIVSNIQFGITNSIIKKEDLSPDKSTFLRQLSDILEDTILALRTSGHDLTLLIDCSFDEQNDVLKFFDSSGVFIEDENSLLNHNYFPQEGGTCAYWTAFFCAEAIKYDSIQEIKNNFDEILLKTAAKVSKFIDQKPAILFEEPASIVDRNFLYKKYRYNNDNPPKSVFMLIDNKKSSSVRLDTLKNMLESKFKQPTVSRIHSIPSEFFS